MWGPGNIRTVKIKKMRIKIGNRYRDYINTLYVVKSYKDKIITFEVDNGKEKDEVLHKSLFESELKGNRFFVDTSSQTISDEDIEQAAKDYHRNNGAYYGQVKTFIDAIQWYREQLRNKK